MERPNSQPFALLGQRLKQFRETRRESLAEVSGAVEIEPDLLERFERGEICPSEEILNLLINHFSLQDQEAGQLWEWAGITPGSEQRFDSLQDLTSKATLVLVAIDSRVQYSDSVNIKVDANGVVFNFMQVGMSGQNVPAARVGMSHEHAERFMHIMESVMLRYKYLPQHKLLPPGDQTASK